MRIRTEPGIYYGNESCGQCGRAVPMPRDECAARERELKIRWDELTRAQQMEVLHDRIRAGMEAFDLTPSEAYLVWNAGCDALVALGPSSIGARDARPIPHSDDSSPA